MSTAAITREREREREEEEEGVRWFLKFESVCWFDDWCLVFKRGIRILESGLWTKGVFKFGSIVAAPFIHSILLLIFLMGLLVTSLRTPGS